MVKLCLCMRRLPHLSREEFLTYWAKRHPRAGGPDAAKILGMRKYAQVRALPEDVNRRVAASRPGVEPEFDGIAEVWVDSVEDFERNWNTGEGKEVFQRFLDDEKNFVDWTRSVVFLAEERVLIDETRADSARSVARKGNAESTG